jgi:peptide/nickel transport system substrate-binding protein
MHLGMMHRGLRASTLLTAIALAFAACSAPARPPETAVIASGTDLESGNPLVTVHPLSRQIQRHALFVTLVKLDSALQPVPYLARSWSWDTSRRVLTFALLRGLKWHDGQPTTGRDVVFTFNSLRDPKLGAPRAGDVSFVTNVVAPDDSTVRFEFSAPQPSLPIVFAELPLVPAHLLDTVPLPQWRTSAFATNPVGNGPFRFTERVAGRRWRFARNDSFPAVLGGPPKLEQFVVAVVDEPATKFAGLVSGELDMAGIAPSMAGLVAHDPTLRLATPPALFSTILAFNTTRAPFNNADVRRGISLAINRQRLVDAAIAGYATPAGSAIPPGVAVAQPTAPLYAPAQADSLLDRAGWTRGANGQRSKNGVQLRVRMLTVGSGDMAAEQLIQADLRERGIAVDILVRELATFLSVVRATTKDFDAAYTGVTGDLALGDLVAMFSSNQRGGALDYTGYHTPALDSALDNARTATPGIPAMKAWHVVDSLLLVESPVAFIYHARGVQGLSRKLDGVIMDLRGELTSITQWTRHNNVTGAHP